MIADSTQIAAPKTRQDAPLSGRLCEIAEDYQRTLIQDPSNIEALLGMCLVALASHQTKAAVQMAQKAVAVASVNSVAWVTLGQALKADAQFAAAESAHREAIRLDSVNPLARMALGELQIASGRPAEAVREYELALRGDPISFSAHLGMGHALGFMGRYEQALEHYRRALALKPQFPEAEFAAGFAMARLGRPNEAETHYRRALTLRPDFAAAWLNLGCLLREQGQDIYAEAALVRAADLRPDMIAAWINLALLELDLRHPDRTETHLRCAYELNPEQVETLVAWCQFRAAERDTAGAWGWLRWALARNPQNDEAVNMHGILLHAQGNFAEAVEVFERAEALGSLPAASNRGNALLDMGKHADALRAHQKACARDPLSPGTRYNLALTQLRLGDWKSGWQGYEARWNFREVHRQPRVFDKPRWCGEPLNGRHILLHAEQGLGDTIQFCRYATQVVARGGLPILQVQAPVERLLRSLPVVRSGNAQIVCLGEAAPAFDLECPLMSLPAVFSTIVENVPWPGAYLGADRLPIEQKQIQLPILKSSEARLQVGLAWAGNPNYKADRQRSTTLESLLPLLRSSCIDWISLQEGDPVAQLSSLPRDVCVWDGSSHDRDLADTAASIASLDLVITTDTCIAHLAGAMGKPVWILLAHLADWRWMEAMDTTPWYPTARLFRQAKPGDWPSVLEQVTEELRWFQPRLQNRLTPTRCHTGDRPAHAA